MVIGGKETTITHEETDNTNGKHVPTGGTLSESSPKKTQDHNDINQQTFTEKFKSPPSKVDKTRKIVLRHVQGRRVSMKKNGGRRGDTKSDTLKKSLDEFLRGNPSLK